MKDIKTDDGILSINLWTGTDDYFILDYAEMNEYLYHSGENVVDIGDFDIALAG